MRIRQRLILGFLGIVAIFAIFGGYLFYVWQTITADMATLDQTFEETSAHTISELESTLHMSLNLETTRRALHELALGHADASADLTQSIENFDRDYAQLRTILVEEGDKFTAARAAVDGERLGAIEEISALDEIESSHEETQIHIESFMDLLRGDQMDAARLLQEEKIEDELTRIAGHLQRFERSIEAHVAAVSQRFDAILHGVEERVRMMQMVTITVLGLGILAAFVMGYYTSEAISEPIERLAEAAVAVETGDYALDSLADVATRKDELGQFARAFEEMAQKVHAREQKLKAQVSALQIEVDRQESAEKVEEITDTDFFKELQAKARAMRATKTKPSPGESHV